jgi:hypothetical protein
VGEDGWQAGGSQGGRSEPPQLRSGTPRKHPLLRATLLGRHRGLKNAIVKASKPSDHFSHTLSAQGTRAMSAPWRL